LVCVDLNFVNWQRAVCINTGIRHFVVPNFSYIPDTCPTKAEGGPLRIIFARRFFIHRGTRIFSNAISRILEEYPHIDITIAGDGPDAPYMHERLDSYSNVHFIRFASNESLKIHQDKDIAIIPTIGSEGTSLSLLEAMASGCAVVCTNVGGMTSIVLDHYIGLMINPDEASLYQAIKLLIEDPILKTSLQKHAYETAKASFSLEMWKERWRHILKKVKNGKL
jgi:glycosyltransferase involved in cell wall biosynthesis